MMKRLLNFSYKAIFWIWNSAFLLFVYLGVLPLIGVWLTAAVFSGQIESEFLVTFLGLLAVPTLCTFLGWRYFRYQPLGLIRLFYGVEAPLFILALIRLFILRELTPASLLVLGTILVAICTFLAELIGGYAQHHKPLAWLQMIPHSLMLLVGFYIGAILLFYAIPTALIFVFALFNVLGTIWQSFIEQPTQFVKELINLLLYTPYIFIGLVLFSISASLFVIMPPAVAGMYIRSGYRVFQKFADQYGKTRAVQGYVVVLTAWIILFINFQQQPQVQAFKLLERPAKTDTARQNLMAQAEPIRAGLLNAYLSSYRYISSVQESNQIRVLYEDIFNFPAPINQVIQDCYNQLMSPFLYQGSPKDSDQAEKGNVLDLCFATK